MTQNAVLEWFTSRVAIFWLLLLVVLSANLAYSFISYQKLTEFEYASINAKLISSKERRSKNGEPYFLLLFRSNALDFRAYSKINMKSNEGRYFDLIVKTDKLSFADTFKAPKLKIESMTTSSQNDLIKEAFRRFISDQHESPQIKELYLNLFLNSEVGSEVEDFINAYGLGAFFAISGLNVALLTGFIFLILSPPFRLFQDRFFPYVNRKVWIFALCFAFLLFYSYLTDFTPSFVRAVIAAIVVFYFALRADEIVNYKTLLLTTAVCVAFFPAFLFSIGFWLSFYGVFLIFLFLSNTEFKSNITVYIALSSWLFLAMMPIIHYLFSLFTLAHLLNTLFGAIFDIFYPISLVLHIVGLGWIFDPLLLKAVKSSSLLSRGEFSTPLWFFISYIALSFLAAFDKRVFFVLNVAIFSYFSAAMLFLWNQGIPG
ncbi:MAG: ComEC/Rec2 family competence protein [Campylobacteraceae bacterium]|jgi:competence protein ComEC|nr:ComEC/Rec2 family competence protein [Campylobacteraceae bacterium]